MFLTALMMALTVYGIFTDKDKDGIPDALEKIRSVLAARSVSQPTGEFTCGSVFKNPTGYYAGELIERDLEQSNVDDTKRYKIIIFLLISSFLSIVTYQYFFTTEHVGKIEHVKTEIENLIYIMSYALIVIVTLIGYINIFYGRPQKLNKK